VLNDDYFLSALAILAQRPPLIERLFVTKEYNKEGVYRLRLHSGGQWHIITIDDFFPCEPKGAPLFAGCADNELWVMIL
jgi:calpain-15